MGAASQFFHRFYHGAGIDIITAKGASFLMFSQDVPETMFEAVIVEDDSRQAGCCVGIPF